MGAIGPNDFPRQANGYGQVSLFCKPICKPDTARQFETEETESTVRDGSVLFAEVTAPARDCAGRQRRALYRSGTSSLTSPSLPAVFTITTSE